MKNSVIMKFRCVDEGTFLAPGKIATRKKRAVLVPLDSPEFFSADSKSAVRLVIGMVREEDKEAAGLFEYGQEYSIEVARIQPRIPYAVREKAGG